MRLIFTLLGLLVVVTIVGFLAKQQVAAVSTLPVPAMAASAAPAASGNVHQQAQQIEQQFKSATEAAMQPKPLPADAQ